MRRASLYFSVITLFLITAVAVDLSGRKLDPANSQVQGAHTEVTSNPDSSPLPTLRPAVSDQLDTKLASWIYPGSAVEQQTTNKLELKSFADSRIVTGWYQAKITALNLSNQSFITNNNNETILNQLTASSATGQVQITISRPPSIGANSSRTQISVSLP